MAEGAGLALELRLLAYLALLALVIWLPYILAAMSARGLTQVVGYPTGNYGELPEWAQRCQRVHVNLVENLVPFGALVLVAQVAGVSNAATILGANCFFGPGSPKRRCTSRAFRGHERVHSLSAGSVA